MALGEDILRVDEFIRTSQVAGDPRGRVRVLVAFNDVPGRLKVDEFIRTSQVSYPKGRWNEGARTFQIPSYALGCPTRPP